MILSYTASIHCYIRKTFILMVQSLWHIHHVYIYTWRITPCSPLAPFLAPYWLPFVSYSTYLAPSSCDRNRPPPSQVACKLTPFPPRHPVGPPHPNSRDPANPVPTNDDLGNILALGVQNKCFAVHDTYQTMRSHVCLQETWIGIYSKLYCLVNTSIFTIKQFGSQTGIAKKPSPDQCMKFEVRVPSPRRWWSAPLSPMFWRSPSSSLFSMLSVLPTFSHSF